MPNLMDAVLCYLACKMPIGCLVSKGLIIPGYITNIDFVDFLTNSGNLLELLVKTAA